MMTPIRLPAVGTVPLVPGVLQQSGMLEAGGPEPLADGCEVDAALDEFVRRLRAAPT